MVFHPVINLFLLILIALVAAAFVFLSARRSVRRRVSDVIRRSFIVVTVVIMGAGPSIPGQAVEVASTLEVYFVIDRTGSMAAEDWDGVKPRIEGVRNDVGTLMGVLAFLDPVVGLEGAYRHAADDRCFCRQRIHGEF